MADLSVISVSGTNQFECRRYVRDKSKEKRKEGWRVLQVDGAVPGAVRNAASGGVFHKGKLLLVVTNPQKIEVSFLSSYRSENNVLMLHQDGRYDKRTKFYKDFVKGLPEHRQITFDLPDKPWELETFSVNFCVKEARVRKSRLDKGLAEKLVKLAGTDIGLLSFEILKASTLAELEGSKEITADHLKRTLSVVQEASVMPLCDGLAVRNPVQVGRALRRIKSTRKRDPTIAVCRFVWSAAVAKWVSIGSLLHQGIPEGEIPSLLDLNPHYFSRRLLPVARRWGWKDLTDLVWVLAVSERGVFEGHVSPWRALESRLLQVVVGDEVR